MKHVNDVAIFWDYENCCVPTNSSGYAVANSISALANSFGKVRSFRAYLEITDNLSLRSELQSSGVSLTDCPHNGRKDVADKMMLADMLIYAIDNPNPCTMVVITGDRDFAYTISMLKIRQYQMVLVTLPNAHKSLTAQASMLIDWTQTIMKPNMQSVRTSPSTVPRSSSPSNSRASGLRATSLDDPPVVSNETPEITRLLLKYSFGMMNPGAGAAIGNADLPPTPVRNVDHLGGSSSAMPLSDTSTTTSQQQPLTPGVDVPGLPIQPVALEEVAPVVEEHFPDVAAPQTAQHPEHHQDVIENPTVGESSPASGFVSEARLGSHSPLMQSTSFDNSKDGSIALVISSDQDDLAPNNIFTTETYTTVSFTTAPTTEEQGSGAATASLINILEQLRDGGLDKPLRSTVTSLLSSAINKIQGDGEDVIESAIKDGLIQEGGPQSASWISLPPFPDPQTDAALSEFHPPPNEFASGSKIRPFNALHSGVWPTLSTLGNNAGQQQESLQPSPAFNQIAANLVAPLPRSAQSSIKPSSSSGPRPIPSHFKPLVKALRTNRYNGESKTVRTDLAPQIADGGATYEKAGVTKFREYVELAAQAGIINVGGTGDGAWVSLRSEWCNSATVAKPGSKPSAQQKVPLGFGQLIKVLQALRKSGESKPKSSVIIAKLKSGTYQMAGVSKWGKYVDLAISKGIVKAGGGQDGLEWISLRSNWHNVDVT